MAERMQRSPCFPRQQRPTRLVLPPLRPCPPHRSPLSRWWRLSPQSRQCWAAASPVSAGAVQPAPGTLWSHARVFLCADRCGMLLRLLHPRVLLCLAWSLPRAGRCLLPSAAAALRHLLCRIAPPACLQGRTRSRASALALCRACSTRKSTTRCCRCVLHSYFLAFPPCTHSFTNGGRQGGKVAAGPPSPSFSSPRPL